MLKSAITAQIILLFAVPIAIALWLRWRVHLSWLLFAGGALAFVAAWIVTLFIPLPVELGLLVSSVVQIGGLYLVYRFLLPTVKTEREALMVGAGQRGIELLILTFFLVLPTFTQMQSLRDASDEELINLAATREDILEEEVEPSDIDELRESIDDYWSVAWYIPLIQTIPLLITIPIQMGLSIIVLGALTRNSPRFLIGAMAMHFLSQSLPGLASYIGGTVLWIGVSLLLGGIAIWFLVRLWPKIQEQTDSAPKEQRKKKSSTA